MKKIYINERTYCPGYILSFCAATIETNVTKQKNDENEKNKRLPFVSFFRQDSEKKKIQRNLSFLQFIYELF